MVHEEDEDGNETTHTDSPARIYLQILYSEMREKRFSCILRDQTVRQTQNQMRETQRKNMKMRKKIKIWFYFPFFWQTSHYIVAGKEKKMFFFRKIKKINENERITWNQLRSIRMVFCIYNDLLYDTIQLHRIQCVDWTKWRRRKRFYVTGNGLLRVMRMGMG